MTLAGTRDAADALVQDTLVRAVQKHDRFEPGAHLLAWLFTTPCNRFSSDYGSRRRKVEDVDGLCAATLSTAPEQPECVAFGPSRDCPRSGAAQAGDQIEEVVRNRFSQKLAIQGAQFAPNLVLHVSVERT